MKRYIKTILPAAAMILSLGLPSCSSDLDVMPIDPNLQTKERINSDNLLNKCYANLAVAGNSGPDGDCDIDGLDGGTTGFVRQMFNANELTTDEAMHGVTQVSRTSTSIPTMLSNQCFEVSIIVCMPVSATATST